MGSLAVQLVIALGGALIGAVLEALNPPTIVPHLHSMPTKAPVSWPLVLAFAVVGGVGALLLVWVVVWLVQFAAYLRKRGRDEWRTVAHVAGNGIGFYLKRHPDAMPDPLSAHGVIECEIRTPGGNVFQRDAEDFGADEKWVYVSGEPPEYGLYDVRWRGSHGSRRDKRKRYEMMRGRSNLSASDEGVSGGVILS